MSNSRFQWIPVSLAIIYFGYYIFSSVFAYQGRAIPEKPLFLQDIWIICSLVLAYLGEFIVAIIERGN